MERLVRRAGIAGIDFENRFAAIKIHFGEPGNMATCGPSTPPGWPDCCVRSARNRSDRRQHALFGTTRECRRPPTERYGERLQPDLRTMSGHHCRRTERHRLPGNRNRREYCKAPKIGAAVADADIVISMTHFKGHEQTGFGGTLKNLGMGCASVGGKLELHCAAQPVVKTENCRGCNICVKHCAHDAIHLNPERKAEIDYSKVRRLRTMHRIMPVRQRVDGGQRYLGTPELQNRRIHEGRAERQAELPCQASS